LPRHTGGDPEPCKPVHEPTTDSPSGEGKTGGGGKINKIFRPFGFRPSKEGMDGDHVMERQLGGPDAINNLWPLPMGENRSSGSTVNTMEVTFAKTKMTVHKAREKRKKKKMLYLLIKSVKTG